MFAFVLLIFSSNGFHWLLTNLHLGQNNLEVKEPPSLPSPSKKATIGEPTYIPWTNCNSSQNYIRDDYPRLIFFFIMPLLHGPGIL